MNNKKYTLDLSGFLFVKDRDGDFGLLDQEGNTTGTFLYASTVRRLGVPVEEVAEKPSDLPAGTLVRVGDENFTYYRTRDGWVCAGYGKFDATWLDGWSDSLNVEYDPRKRGDEYQGTKEHPTA